MALAGRIFGAAGIDRERMMGESGSFRFETVTKLDAVERQLCVAIRLFFERKDKIAVHTLAAAAQGAVRKLGKAKGFKGIYDIAEEVIQQDKVKEFKDALRHP